MGWVGMKILLIDEQELVLRTVKDFLTDSGHAVLTAGTVSEALELDPSVRARVDVIVMDAGVVREVVIDAVEKVHEAFPDADLLVMDHVHLDCQYAVSRRVFAFVRKPVHLTDLDLLLCRIMEKRNKRMSD